jgi:hypothetical protein
VDILFNKSLLLLLLLLLLIWSSNSFSVMIDIWTKVNNIGFIGHCEKRAFNCETARNTKRFIYVYTRVYCEFIVIRWRTSVQRREHSLHVAPSD